VAKKKLTKEQELKELTRYVAFLKKRLDSKNFQANVPVAEVEKTKEQYKKAKFRLKSLTM